MNPLIWLWENRWRLLLTVVLAVLWALLWDFFPGVNLHREPAKAGAVSQSSLKKSYQNYNAQYFEDKLPKDSAIDYDLSDPNFMATTMLASDGKFHLSFNRYYITADRVADLIMLHEMCHIKNWDDGHGRKWRSCMINLDLQGAFREELIDSYTEKMK